MVIQITEKIPTTSGIYIITNPTNGRKYIGKASNFRERLVNHISMLRRGKHRNSDLQSEWNEETFTITIHSLIDDPTERHQKETELIQENLDGYNIIKSKNTEFEVPAPYGKVVMGNIKKMRERGFI